MKAFAQLSISYHFGNSGDKSGDKNTGNAESHQEAIVRFFAFS
ncbi:hypothetical protein [Pedobacter steynii]|nr:hypothetical protein [Pedobacter steynii]